MTQQQKTYPVAALMLSAALLFVSPVLAQDAPPPHKSPRTPVSRQALPDHAAPPPARQVQGVATIIDGERLRIADTDMRLFGIVPPQLSASFGPQARAALDTLANNQPITCAIRDRDHDGRFLATCRGAANTDLAQELLRRGLAVTARGSLAGTDLAASYLAAEQGAQVQRAGLWSVAIPAAAAPAPVEVVKLEAAKTEAEAAAPDIKIEPKADEHKEEKAEKAAVKADKIEKDRAEKTDKADAAITDAMIARSVPVVVAPAAAEPDFFDKYQALFACLLIFLTAFGIRTELKAQRRREKREERRVLAAGLRGELMAARAVCQARLKSIRTDEDERAVVWPRIRATLYQAAVGRIGLLGAELSRQISSIYGQTSDYAAYYSHAPADQKEGGETRAASKRQALEMLVHHIDEVLPKLAYAEQKGRIPPVTMTILPRVATQVTPPAASPPGEQVGMPTAQTTAEPLMPETAAEPQNEPVNETATETWQAEGIASSYPQSQPDAQSQTQAQPQTQRHAAPRGPRTVPASAVKTTRASPATTAHTGLWETMRKFARTPPSAGQTARHNVRELSADEIMSDYAALIEEDMARYALHGEAGLGEAGLGQPDSASETGRPRRQ